MPAYFSRNKKGMIHLSKCPITGKVTQLFDCLTSAYEIIKEVGNEGDSGISEEG